MPAIYAHEKFGKLVYEQLSDDDKKIIEKYPDAYRIGLQGPDYLFFYRGFYKNKINQLGRFYHHQDAYIFMKNALAVIKQSGTDSSQYSYILGFICHFAMDDACHPYVYRAMKQTDCGHAEIEGDFDRFLIEKDGFLPQEYRLFELVPTDSDTAESIRPFYSEMTVKKIQKCLKWMKFIKHFFYAPHIVKRTLVDLMMRATFHYKKFNGHIIMPNANKRCMTETKQLEQLMYQTIPKTVSLTDNFKEARDSGLLSDDFHKDFYGRKMK